MNLLLAVLLAAVQDEKTNYQDHVLPVFRNHCLTCHDADKRKGDLDLSSFSATMAGGSSGDVVAAGDSGSSALYRTVAHLADPRMPPKKPKISDAEIAVIKRWVDGGLLETSSSSARKPKKAAVDLGAGAAPRVKPAGPPALPEELLLEPVKRTRRAEASIALAASPWAPVAAVAAPHQVLLYRTDTLELAGVLPYPERKAHVLRFSRDGSLLMAGGGQDGKRGRVVLWDVKTGDRKVELGDEHDVVLAADVSSDHALVALGGPGKIFKIHDARDGDLLHAVKKHTDWVTALEFSPDAKMLATGDRSSGLHVWEAATGRILFTLSGHKGAITDLSWRSDSRLLASASEDGQVTLWETQGGTKVKGWAAHPGGTASVKFSSEGLLVTSGRDKLVRLWNAEGAKQRDFEAFGDLALQGVATFDGKRVLGGDWTGEIRIWNAADGARVGLLSGNPPTLAERVEADTQALSESKVKSETAAGALRDAEAGLTKAAEAVKAADAAAAQAKAALDAAATRAGNADKVAVDAQKALAAAGADLAARQAEATAKGNAAQLAQVPVTKAKDDVKKAQEAAAELLKQVETDPAKAKDVEPAQRVAAEKAAELAKAVEAAQKAKAEAEAAANAQGPARKALEEAQAKDKAAGADRAAAQAALAQATQAHAAAAKSAGELKANADAAQAAVTRAQQARTEAAARVADLEKRLVRWKAEQFNVTVHARKAEVEKIRAQHKALLDHVEDAQEEAQDAAEAAQAAALAARKACEAVEGLEQSLAEAKAGPAKADKALEEARRAAGDRETRALRAAAFAGALGESAKAEPQNATLAAAQAKAGEAVELLKKDAADARAAVEARQKDLEAAKTAVVAAEKALKEGRGAAEAADRKSVQAAQAAKAAASKIAPVQAKADAFKPTLDAALADLEKLKAEYRARK
jgi:hypothetical protein